MNPNIEPQTCYAGNEEDLKNFGGRFFAQEKLDGHRAIMVCTKTKNYFYSRRTSDVTGEKEDNTDRLPFLANLNLDIFDGTIFDGELVATWTNSNSTEVQRVLGSTPERAAEMWREGYQLRYVVFDVIQWMGEDVSTLPYYQRIDLLLASGIFFDRYNLNGYIDLADAWGDKNLFDLHIPTGIYRYFAECESYEELLKELYEKGSEGLILKDLNSPYEFKRSKNWLKFKMKVTADLVVMGYVKPKKDYTGKFSVEELKERGWEYWEDGVPVSKTYAKGWVGGLKLGAYKDGKLKYITTVKGFSDEVQEYIKCADTKGNVVEVSYQGVINPETKSLRHPRFNCWREDKAPESCKWEDI